MIRLTQENLSSSIHCSSSQIFFHNKLFTREANFPKDDADSAFQSCQKHCHSLSCLLVEHQSHLSVWVEYQPSEEIKVINFDRDAEVVSSQASTETRKTNQVVTNSNMLPGTLAVQGFWEKFLSVSKSLWQY